MSFVMTTGRILYCQASIDQFGPNPPPCDFCKGPNPLLVHENNQVGRRSKAVIVLWPFIIMSNKRSELFNE